MLGGAGMPSTLKSVPIEAGRLGSALCVLVAPKKDLDGAQKVDRDGAETWLVSVAVVPPDGRAALIEVSVPGEPKGLTPGMPVGFVELSAFHWEIDGRSGISFRADRVVPALAPAPAAPAAAVKSAAGGGK